MNNMIELDITIFFQLVNFLVTMVVLNFLLIKPIRDHIRARNSFMASTASEVDKFAQSADGKLAGYEASLQEAKAAASKAREAIKTEAVSKEQEIISKSQADAQAFIQSSRDKIRQDCAAAKEILLSQVDAFAQKAAAKILN